MKGLRHLSQPSSGLPRRLLSAEGPLPPWSQPWTLLMKIGEEERTLMPWILRNHGKLAVLDLQYIEAVKPAVMGISERHFFLWTSQHNTRGQNIGLPAPSRLAVFLLSDFIREVRQHPYRIAMLGMKRHAMLLTSEIRHDDNQYSPALLGGTVQRASTR